MKSPEELVLAVKSQDWEFENEDTQYASHNIHRYSGKFIPQIARSAIQLLSDPGDIILDPYLGSGTTALEAILLDRKCIGIDINPLAILISKVKTTVLPVDLLKDFQARLIESLRCFDNGQLTISFYDNLYKGTLSSPEDSKRYTDDWNKKWYQDHVLRQLIMIYDVIEGIPEEELRNIAIVAFSDILRKSSNASSKYPNVMYDKNHSVKPLPLKSFISSFTEIINKLIDLSLRVGNTHCNCQIILENNTNLSMESEYADAIVTHPPYIAAVPYAEYGSLSLEWLQYSSKELDSKLTGGKRHSKDVTSRFENDYRKMISEAYRVLKLGKYAFFMVGNPTQNGQIVDLHEMTVRLAEEQGFKHLCTAARNGMNRRGNKMGSESLIFLQKTKVL